MGKSLNPRIRIFGIAIGIAFALFAAGELMVGFGNFFQGRVNFVFIGMAVAALAVLLVGFANSLLLKEVFDDDFRDGGKIGRVGFIFLLLGQALDWYWVLSVETPVERFSLPIAIGVRTLTAVGWLVLLRAAFRMRSSLPPCVARCGIAAAIIAVLYNAVPSNIAPLAVAAVYAAAMSVLGTVGLVAIVRNRS